MALVNRDNPNLSLHFWLLDDRPQLNRICLLGPKKNVRVVSIFYLLEYLLVLTPGVSGDEADLSAGYRRNGGCLLIANLDQRYDLDGNESSQDRKCLKDDALPPCLGDGQMSSSRMTLAREAMRVLTDNLDFRIRSSAYC